MVLPQTKQTLTIKSASFLISQKNNEVNITRNLLTQAGDTGAIHKVAHFMVKVLSESQYKNADFDFLLIPEEYKMRLSVVDNELNETIYVDFEFTSAHDYEHVFNIILGRTKLVVKHSEQYNSIKCYISYRHFKTLNGDVVKNVYNFNPDAHLFDQLAYALYKSEIEIDEKFQNVFHELPVEVFVNKKGGTDIDKDLEEYEKLSDPGLLVNNTKSTSNHITKEAVDPVIKELMAGLRYSNSPKKAGEIKITYTKMNQDLGVDDIGVALVSVEKGGIVINEEQTVVDNNAVKEILSHVDFNILLLWAITVGKAPLFPGVWNKGNSYNNNFAFVTAGELETMKILKPVNVKNEEKSENAGVLKYFYDRVLENIRTEYVYWPNGNINRVIFHDKRLLYPVAYGIVTKNHVITKLTKAGKTSAFKNELTRYLSEGDWLNKLININDTNSSSEDELTAFINSGSYKLNGDVFEFVDNKTNATLFTVSKSGQINIFADSDPVLIINSKPPKFKFDTNIALNNYLYCIGAILHPSFKDKTGIEIPEIEKHVFEDIVAHTLTDSKLKYVYGINGNTIDLKFKNFWTPEVISDDYTVTENESIDVERQLLDILHEELNKDYDNNLRQSLLENLPEDYSDLPKLKAVWRPDDFPDLPPLTDGDAKKFEDILLDEYNKDSSFPSTPNIVIQCGKCKMDLSQTMSYTCIRPDCPCFFQMTC